MPDEQAIATASVAEEIVQRIRAFEARCEAHEYTDTGEVWDLLHWIQETLERPSPAEELASGDLIEPLEQLSETLEEVKGAMDQPRHLRQGPAYKMDLEIAIRQWRRRTAEAKKWPPYRVITEVAINALVERRPTTLSEVRQATSWGDRKMKQFGEEVLAVMKEAEGL